MERMIGKKGTQRDVWAISLCYAAALLMSLEALHGNACAWMGLQEEQSFLLSASFASLTVFLGTFLLARMIAAWKSAQ